MYPFGCDLPSTHSSEPWISKMNRLQSKTFAIARDVRAKSLHLMILACALLIGSSPATAQDYEECSAEVRTSLSFRVSEAAILPLLPPGWSVRPIADAPGKVNIDRKSVV